MPDAVESPDGFVDRRAEERDEDSPFGGRRDPVYATAAGILAFLAGCFGFMALYHDYPSDPWTHYVELAGLHGVLATFVGGLARGTWKVSIIVAWGAIVMGLPWHLVFGVPVGVANHQPWSYAVFAYGVVVPVTIAGGWVGNWVVGRLVR
jgi:hypothetical protein